MATMFDPSKVDDNAFPVVPAGTYRALVENAEIKTTKASTGRYLQVNLSLLDQHRGAKVMAFLNFENLNQIAQNIGRAQVKKFLASLGITSAVDLDQIGFLTKNKMTTVEVEIEDTPRGPQNRVATFVAPQAGAIASNRQDAPHPADAPF